VNRGSLGCLLELLETLLVTVLVFAVVQMFVAQPFEVQQESMENTLLPGQYVLVDKLTPHFDAYHRGDVVVFTPPAGWSRDAADTPFVKRVIGVAGDTVTIKDGKVFLNGDALAEPYVYGSQKTTVPSSGSATWTIAPGHLFVMGDHREASQDSREFGPIETSSVIGRIWIRYWPFDSFGRLPDSQASPSPGAPSPAASHK